MNVVLRLMDAAVEFVWWVGGGVGVAQSFSCPAQLQFEVVLPCRWGCDNFQLFLFLT